MSVSILEELEQLADAFTNENNPQRLVELSKQLLVAIERVEAQIGEPEPRA